MRKALHKKIPKLLEKALLILIRTFRLFYFKSSRSSTQTKSPFHPGTSVGTHPNDKRARQLNDTTSNTGETSGDETESGIVVVKKRQRRSTTQNPKFNSIKTPQLGTNTAKTGKYVSPINELCQVLELHRLIRLSTSEESQTPYLDEHQSCYSPDCWILCYASWNFTASFSCRT